jgi:hypothetical protein
MSAASAGASDFSNRLLVVVIGDDAGNVKVDDAGNVKVKAASRSAWDRRLKPSCDFCMIISLKKVAYNFCYQREFCSRP